MSKDKIELRVKNNQLHVGINGNGSVVLEDRMSDPHSDGLISTIYATVFHPSGHAHELGIQLSKSYNSTYGQNINPEAVPYLVQALADLLDCHEKENGWISNACILNCKNAIEKATIK